MVSVTSRRGTGVISVPGTWKVILLGIQISLRVGEIDNETGRLRAIAHYHFVYMADTKFNHLISRLRV